MHLYKGTCLSIWHVYIGIYSVILEECHNLIFIKYPNVPSMCVAVTEDLVLLHNVHEDSLEKFLTAQDQKS